MTYLDKYPNCIGCPVSKYCGTAVSSIRLCHSYKEPTSSASFMAVSSEMSMTKEELDEYAAEMIALQYEIK